MRERERERERRHNTASWPPSSVGLLRQAALCAPKPQRRERTPSLSRSNLMKVTLRYSGALLRLLMNLVISAGVRDCVQPPGHQLSAVVAPTILKGCCWERTLHHHVPPSTSLLPCTCTPTPPHPAIVSSDGVAAPPGTPYPL